MTNFKRNNSRTHSVAVVIIEVAEISIVVEIKLVLFPILRIDNKNYASTHFDQIDSFLLFLQSFQFS